MILSVHSMIPSPPRTLLQALIVSLLVHAALLLSMYSPYPLPWVSRFSTLDVVLVHDDRGERSLPDGTPETTPPRTVAPPKPVIRQRTSKQGVPAETLAIQRAEPHTVSISPPLGNDSLPSPDRNVEGGGGAAPATAASRAGVNADDMRQYRLSLATSARRFKRYPALARERGWEGATEVALRVSALLPAPDVELVSSSGRSVLDEQALEMIRQAARITLLPEGLKGRDFRIVLPVKFSIDGDQ